MLAALVIALSSFSALAGELQFTTESELRDSKSAEQIEDFWRDKQANASFTGRGGLRLHGLRFRQSEPRSARGAIVIVSGRTEAAIKYKEVIYDLWRNGYSVYIYDHRGQGFSERERNTTAQQHEMGHVNRFDDYVDDLSAFMARSVLPDGHAKHYLIAHSMGGAIAARYLQSGVADLRRISAAVLMSPMLQIEGLVAGLPADVISCRLAWLQAKAGRSAQYRYRGSDYEAEPFEKNEYTQSEVRYTRLVETFAKEPKARIGAQSWGWIDQACKSAELAREQAARARRPVMVIVAGEDTIVHNEGADKFCRQRKGCNGTADGKPLVVRAARHELMIERDPARGQALRAAMEFFDRH